MKNFKKFFAILFMSISLCGCGGTNTCANGHELVVDRNLSTLTDCKIGGTVIMKCKNCSYTDTYTIFPDSEHQLIRDEDKCVEPTCIDAGHIYSHCKFCNYEKDEKVEALGHSYSETIIKDSTCTSCGSKKLFCSRCGDQKTVDMPLKDHSYVQTDYKSSSCTSAGYRKYECSVCGKEYTETLPLESHHYSDGQCIFCGKKDPDSFTLSSNCPCTVSHGSLSRCYVELYDWSYNKSTKLLSIHFECKKTYDYKGSSGTCLIGFTYRLTSNGKTLTTGNKHTSTGTYMVGDIWYINVTYTNSYSYISGSVSVNVSDYVA